MAKEITSKEDNYSQWYNDIVVKAGLADYSAVRGCMVIKPYGFAIWEKIQRQLDNMFKATGHQNAYFPLFIPKSFFSKEASHVEGFAKECAIVTHYRLKNDPNGKGVIVDPEAKLEEELIVRPILINQWANVVRWEMRTRLFLRTTEFLWQEGHTAHATKEEAIDETLKMVHVYADFAEKWMGIPVLIGTKSEGERFAGALDTYCIEALMQDGKALQAGTSHFLGQNFAKAFDVKFATKDGDMDYVWATSWGVSTRLMGALVMAHSDDKGLVLPPKLAPTQVVFVPIYRNDEELEKVSEKVLELKLKLESKGITTHYDDRDTLKPGFKFAEYEMKGYPIRIAIGPKDLEKNTAEVARRDTLTKEFVNQDILVDYIIELLDKIQSNIFQKALKFREKNTIAVDSYKEFKKVLDDKGGFILAHWDGTKETEERIKEETKATIRLIPLTGEEVGLCMITGKASKQRVVFARAY